MRRGNLVVASRATSHGEKIHGVEVCPVRQRAFPGAVVPGRTRAAYASAGATACRWKPGHRPGVRRLWSLRPSRALWRLPSWRPVWRVSPQLCLPTWLPSRSLRTSLLAELESTEGGRTMNHIARRIGLGLCLAAATMSLSGCIYALPGPDWCYYHPYRCR